MVIFLIQEYNCRYLDQKYHLEDSRITGRYILVIDQLNSLMPNDHYSGRTASLTSKRCILCIYSTNIGTEYFKHGIHSPCFSFQNAVFS
jgi:hypothetical protein